MTETPAALPPSTPPLVGSGPQGEEKTLVIVIYVLHLAGFFTAGFTNIVGVVMSYVLKADASAWAQSHYAFQIRTFWIALIGTLAGLAAFVVSIPLCFILIGIPLLLASCVFLCAIGVWLVVRCIVGLIAAAEDRPYPRPQAWMA